MSPGIKKIREALGISQAEFGRRIGKSMQSIQAYERGTRISPPAQKAIVELAQQAGLGDLVDDFLAEREEIAPGLPIVGRPDARTARLHDMLDQVLAGGDQAAVRAVRAVIETFARRKS